MTINTQYKITHNGQITLSSKKNAPMIVKMLMLFIIAWIGLNVPAQAGGFNGTGTYNRYFNWTNDKNNGINITASRFDTEDSGFATGLSTTITKDGQQTTTARIPFAVGLSINQGVANTPSISFIGDNATGFYQTSTGQISIAASGSNVGTFTSVGLGIGTAAPRTALDINTGTLTAGGLNVSGSGSINIGTGAIVAGSLNIGTGAINAGSITGTSATVGTGTVTAGQYNIGASQIALGNLASIGTNTVAANIGTSSASPAATALPSCPDTSGNHLNYTTGGTGFTCGVSASYFSTQHVVTGSRNFGTVYQNTNGKTMMVTATAGVTSGSVQFEVYTDSNSSPSTNIIGALFNTNVGAMPITFLVLSGNYYEITAGGGGSTGANPQWTEWY